MYQPGGSHSGVWTRKSGRAAGVQGTISQVRRSLPDYQLMILIMMEEVRSLPDYHNVILIMMEEL